MWPDARMTVVATVTATVMIPSCVCASTASRARIAPSVSAVPRQDAWQDWAHPHLITPDPSGVCPGGKAWADIASGYEVAHADFTECCNMVSPPWPSCCPQAHPKASCLRTGLLRPGHRAVQMPARLHRGGLRAE
jgi:hypothetical protein